MISCVFNGLCVRWGFDCWALGSVDGYANALERISSGLSAEVNEDLCKIITDESSACVSRMVLKLLRSRETGKQANARSSNFEGLEHERVCYYGTGTFSVTAFDSLGEQNDNDD